MSPPPPCAVVVLAKCPDPGRAKTRLVPALGADGAAALAARMLRHALDTAHAAALGGGVELCLAPRLDHPAAADAARRHPALALALQCEGDLGARMRHALQRALRRTPGAALLVGTDAPAVAPALLRRAAAALRGHDAVFAPALDGGYVLVGVSRDVPALFDAALPWSTPALMAATRAAAAATGLRLVECGPALPDIDEPADLRHLPDGWPERDPRKVAAPGRRTASGGPRP